MEKTNVLFLLTPKTKVACLKDTMNLRQALEKMRAHGYMAIPLINSSGQYLDTVAEGDLLYQIVDSAYEHLEDIKVADLKVRTRVPAVKVDCSMDELVEKIIVFNFVPVVDDRDVLMGIVTRRRVLEQLLQEEQA